MREFGRRRRRTKEETGRLPLLRNRQKKEMDQLREQVQASDQRLRELDSDSQRAIGRIEGTLEVMREAK